MCNIAYVPKFVDISDETIKILYRRNPDGAGLMWKPFEGAPIEIRKGFFNVDELIRTFRSIPKNCDRAIHCRIATTGKVSAQCCHPFPVRECTRSMKEKSTCTDVAIMHNGIISMTTPPQGVKSPFSDTMMFAKEVLYPLKHALGEHYIQALVEKGIGTSRLLIFRQFGETIMLGDWVKDGKLYFSNNNYKEYSYSYSSGYSYGGTYYSGSKAVTPAKKDEAKKETKELPTKTVTVQAPVQTPVPKQESVFQERPDGYDAVSEYDDDDTPFTQAEVDKMMAIVTQKELDGEFDDEDGDLDMDKENDFIRNYNPDDYRDWVGDDLDD